MSSKRPGGGVPSGVFRIRLSYDGRGFWGSQRQAGQRSVQEDLERAAETIFARPIPVYLAGRTDRGVHAAGQVASFADFRSSFPVSRIVPAFNDHLDHDVAVLEAHREPVGFHARYSATWREYRYRIWCGVRQPLAHGVVAFNRDRLNLERMNSAAQRLVGDHDFSSFASGGEGVPWTTRGSTTRGAVRRVFECRVTRAPNWWGAQPGDGELVEIRIVADGFLPRMVRGVAGTLVEVGREKISVADTIRLIEIRDRRQAPKNAPSEGLVLWAIGYDEYANSNAEN
ncbi:tRNA pseudouridine(38-40) synthase TruA [soil metagenome]